MQPISIIVLYSLYVSWGYHYQAVYVCMHVDDDHEVQEVEISGLRK